MEVEELAMCILDRLASTPEDRRNDLMTRSMFLHHHVGDAYSQARRKLEPFGAFSFDSDTATRAFPDYARALAEAWTFLESQGYLVPEPGPTQKVFVGQRGLERHAMYRGGAASSQGGARDGTDHSGEVPATEAASASAATKATPSDGGDRDPPPNGEDHPTAVVIWAHDDPDWSADEKEAWEKTIVAFVQLLNVAGIDTDLDLYHGDEPTDWARFGPQAIRNSDYVVVAVSPVWRRAYESATGPGVNPGAISEADTLRGLFKDSSDEFRKRVVPVILPGRDERDVPQELRSTVAWVRVSELTDKGIEALLRRLTGQPTYKKPPVGPRRELPAQTVSTPTSSAGPRIADAEARNEELKGQIGRAEGALDELPPASSGTNEEPWDQARRSIDSRLSELTEEVRRLQRRASASESVASEPRLEPLIGHGTGTFNLHLPAGPLHAHLRNTSEGDVEVLAATLETPRGTFAGEMYAEEPPPLAPDPQPSTSLPKDGHLVINFGESEFKGLQESTDPLAMVIRYRQEGSTQVYEMQLSLHRAPAVSTGRPQWRARGVERFPVE